MLFILYPDPSQEAGIAALKQSRKLEKTVAFVPELVVEPNSVLKRRRSTAVDKVRLSGPEGQSTSLATHQPLEHLENDSCQSQESSASESSSTPPAESSSYTQHHRSELPTSTFNGFRWAHLQTRLYRTLTIACILMMLIVFLVYLLDRLVPRLRPWQLSTLQASTSFACRQLGFSSFCPLLCMFPYISLLIPSTCSPFASTDDAYQKVFPAAHSGIAAALASNNVLYTHRAPTVFADYHNTMHRFRGQLYATASAHELTPSQPECFDIASAIESSDKFLGLTATLPLEFQGFLTALGSTANIALARSHYAIQHLRLVRASPPANDFVARLGISFRGYNAEESSIRDDFGHHIAAISRRVEETSLALSHLQSNISQLAAYARNLHEALSVGHANCATAKASVMSDRAIPVRLIGQYGLAEIEETRLLTNSLKLLGEMLNWIPEQQRYLNVIQPALAGVRGDLEHFMKGWHEGGFLKYRVGPAAEWDPSTEDTTRIAQEATATADWGGGLDEVVGLMENGAVVLRGDYERFELAERAFWF